MNPPLNVIKYCAREVERQHCGPLQVYDMCNAWDYCFNSAKMRPMPTLEDVMVVAMLVENTRQINPIMDQRNWRKTNVTINNIGIGAKPDRIDAQMSLWPVKVEIATIGDHDQADWLIKRLLDIHPWADGNGRTASLIRNWMIGYLNDPEMLPYYYGEE